MRRDIIRDEYFDWLYGIVSDRDESGASFNKLIRCLHGIEFTFKHRMDVNRAKDGVELRDRFAWYRGYEDLSEYLDGPCTVLEMMVALALRCEETLMDDPTKGDRTRQWFWGMVVNLGLGAMYDSNFNERTVLDAVKVFLRRQYSYDGKGGLFTVKHPARDMRTVEIWVQLCWYINTIR